MGRLTEKDECGNWCLKGVAWSQLHAGSVITKKVSVKLYGALCKLKDYEDTGLSPEDVERLNDFERSEVGKLLKALGEERRKHAWIQIEQKLPDPDEYVLVSFDNFSLPMIGRYTVDDDGGGTFRIGDDDESFVQHDLFVNAWMPLPEPYKDGDD